MSVHLSRRQLLLGSAAGALAACLPDGRFKRRYPVVPARLDDGWEIATPAEMGVDESALEAIHEELLREDRQRGALGLLVIKEGRLVWETYLHDARDRDRHHHVQSATKSVTSLAFGLARDRGHFESLDLTLADLIPEELIGAAQDKGEINLEQLLTMRSGIAFDNDAFSVEMWVDKPKRPLRYMLEKRLATKPGERFEYRDVDPQILGYLLQRQVEQPEEAWVQKQLFQPLGIQDYLWERGADGASMAAHGLHLRPRDMAKLGQLMLDEGMFAGARIVSSEWVRASTRTLVRAGARGTGNARLGYGYYWWTVEDQNVYAAWGHGGQHILVAPESRLVLVKIALPDTDNFSGSSLEELVALVAPLLA